MSIIRRARRGILPLTAIAVLLSPSCGFTSTSPSDSASGPALAITIAANPNPIAGALCTGCGAGSTEREVLTTVIVTETGGGAGTVTTLTVTLRDAAGAVAANVEFDSASITQAAGGSNRVAALGRLVFPTGVHYSTSFLGRSGSLTLAARAVDARGTATASQIAVPVSPM